MVCAEITLFVLSAETVTLRSCGCLNYSRDTIHKNEGDNNFTKRSSCSKLDQGRTLFCCDDIDKLVSFLFVLTFYNVNILKV